MKKCACQQTKDVVWMLKSIRTDADIQNILSVRTRPIQMPNFPFKRNNILMIRAYLGKQVAKSGDTMTLQVVIGQVMLQII